RQPGCQRFQAEHRKQLAWIAHGLAPLPFPVAGAIGSGGGLQGGGGSRYHVRLILTGRRGGQQEVQSMATLGMNDVKNGQKILVNNEPAIITDTEYVKPGKGQAFTRVKYRLIRSGRVQEITMKATDSLESADVVDTDMQFLYAD